MATNKTYRGSWSAFINKDVLAEHDKWAHSKGGRRLHLEGCCLDTWVARGSKMIDARFERCSFRNADLSYSILEDLELEDCVLHKASFVSSTLVRAILYSCVFQQADLRITRLKMADIVKSDFSKALLDRADFADAILKETNLRGAHIYDATFDRAYVGFCDFRGADLSCQDMKHLCTSVDTWFFRCDFRNAKFEGRPLNRTRFTRCRFQGLRGKPLVEGPCTIERPNLLPDDDAEDDKSTAEDVLALWAGRTLESVPVQLAEPPVDEATMRQRAIGGDLQAMRTVALSALQRGERETVDNLLNTLLRTIPRPDEALRLQYELSMRLDPPRIQHAHDALRLLSSRIDRQRSRFDWPASNVRCLDWAPSAELLVAGVDSKLIGVSLVTRKSELRSSVLAECATPVLGVSLSYDGRSRCLVNGDERSLEIRVRFVHDPSWRALPSAFAVGLQMARLSPDGSYIAIASHEEKNLVTLVRFDTLEKVAQLEMSEPQQVLAFSRDNQRLACVGKSGQLTLWDRRQGSPQQVPPGSDEEDLFTGVHFTAAGILLVTLDGRVHRMVGDHLERSWRAPLELPSEEALVFPAAVSPGGRWLAYSLGRDLVVVESLVEPHRLGHSLRVVAPNLLCFTPTGHLLAVDSAAARADRYELDDIADPPQ